MTPNQKAIDLRFEFWKLCDLTPEQSKLCAHLAVDQLIKYCVELSIQESGSEHIDFGQVHFREVKQEIEKL